MRYWIIAILTGTFKNIADEFYRRVGVPYENVQIVKSGDVLEYEEFVEQISKL
jgi:phosphoserine phosphatase